MCRLSFCLSSDSNAFYAFANNSTWRALCFRVVRPSVRCALTPIRATRYLSSLGGAISIKLGTNIHHASGNC